MADELRRPRAPRPAVFRALTSDDCGDDDGLVCPLLLEKIPTGTEVAVCGDCATIHDAAAWRENGGCALLGCPSAPNARRDTPDAVLRVSADDVARVGPIAPLPPPFPPAVPPAVPSLRAPAPPPLPPPPIPGRSAWPAPSAVAGGFAPPPPPPPPIPSWLMPPPIAAPAVRPIERTVRADEAGKSCPYSMEPFALGAEVAECPKCGQVLSRESWRENRGCTTYGCEGAPDFRKDTPRIPPPIL